MNASKHLLDAIEMTTCRNGVETHHKHSTMILCYIAVKSPVFHNTELF